VPLPWKRPRTRRRSYLSDEAFEEDRREQRRRHAPEEEVDVEYERIE
jgi:hypothetical protein